MKLRWFIGLLLGICIAIPTFAQVTDAEHAASNNSVQSQPAPPSPRRTPLVYGYVNGDGTKASGTPNFTVTWNASSNWYEIKITNINYFFSNYSTVVTVSIPHQTFCHTDSISGLLLIRCFTISGSPTQAYFGFGTF